MRIALVVHKFPPASLGGTEVYTQGLARALAGRHEVSVFYRDDGDGSARREGWQEREGYRAWRVGCAFDARAASLASLFLDTFLNVDVERSFGQFLGQARPEVVHFQHLMALSCRLVAMARPVPTLLTLHDYWFICANSQLIRPDLCPCRGKALGLSCVRCGISRVRRAGAWLLYPSAAPLLQMRDRLVRRAALQARRLIAPSRFLINRYVAEGFPAERFEWLENGIDVARIRAFPRRPAQDGRLRVTYLGAVAWQKGVHVLAEAACALPPERLRLRAFGSLDTFPDYVDSVREVANPAHTSLEGVLPHEDVGQILADTDVLVVPSLWYENSPVVIQEAFAAGVPVVASRLGAMEEKVHDGVDGLLVAPGDVGAWEGVLRRLVEEDGLVERLRRGVPQVMGVDEHVRRVEALYEAVVARPG